MSLRIDETLKPVLPLAKAHNALVDLMTTMQGINGIKITVSENKIIFDFDASDAAGTIEGNVVNVLAEQGQVIKVPRHSTYTTPNVYTNSFLVQVLPSGYSTHLGANGVTVNWNTQNYSQVTSQVIKLVNSSNSAFFGQAGVSFDNGSNSVDVLFSAITKDMSIREVDVCDNNVAKKMLIIGSAPY